jgi:hypothetical protein
MSLCEPHHLLCFAKLMEPGIDAAANHAGFESGNGAMREAGYPAGLAP